MKYKFEVKTALNIPPVCTLGLLIVVPINDAVRPWSDEIDAEFKRLSEGELAVPFFAACNFTESEFCYIVGFEPTGEQIRAMNGLFDLCRKYGFACKRLNLMDLRKDLGRDDLDA